MGKKSYLCLCDIPLFSGLGRDAFETVCHAASKLVRKKGEYLFRQGDAADAVYVVKEGIIKLSHTTENGEEVIMQIVSAGELLGETALFRGQGAQPVSAVAMEESRVCCIDRSAFESVVKANPDLAWQLIENLGSRLYDSYEHITSSNTQSAREKVLGLFIKLAQEHGEACAEGRIIRLKLTQQEIASLVGASRVMVSQVISDLIASRHLCREDHFYILRTRCF